MVCIYYFVASILYALICYLYLKITLLSSQLSIRNETNASTPSKQLPDFPIILTGRSYIHKSIDFNSIQVELSLMPTNVGCLEMYYHDANSNSNLKFFYYNWIVLAMQLPGTLVQMQYYIFLDAAQKNRPYAILITKFKYSLYLDRFRTLCCHLKGQIHSIHFTGIFLIELCPMFCLYINLKRLDLKVHSIFYFTYYLINNYRRDQY